MVGNKQSNGRRVRIGAFGFKSEPTAALSHSRKLGPQDKETVSKIEKLSQSWHDLELTQSFETLSKIFPILPVESEPRPRQGARSAVSDHNKGWPGT